ncbi:MAG: hypothetical protein RLY97_89 [Pseudomonadota bacterium]|jgi:hypothetical protein
MSAELAKLRQQRDQARADFTGRLDRARHDLTGDAVKDRILADLQHTGIRLANETIEIANDSRGIIAGTLTVLAVYLARKPIGEAVLSAWERKGKGLKDDLVLKTESIQKKLLRRRKKKIEKPQIDH